MRTSLIQYSEAVRPKPNDAIDGRLKSSEGKFTNLFLMKEQAARRSLPLIKSQLLYHPTYKRTWHVLIQYLTIVVLQEDTEILHRYSIGF